MSELILFTFNVFVFLGLVGLGTCVLIMLALLIKIGWGYLTDKCTR